MSINNPSDFPTTEASISRFFSGELSANPFPLFKQMRSMGALVPISLPARPGTKQQAWMVTRWQEAVQVLKDHKRFSSDASSLGVDIFFQQGAQSLSEGAAIFGKSMLVVDEPDHLRLRGLVSKVFTPKYIEGLRPRIQQLADELLNAVQNQGTMDLVRDFAYPLPINVISEMLGVPSNDQTQIRVWSEAVASGFMLQDEEHMGQIRASFFAYIQQLVIDKRHHPQDDLISRLVQVEEEGDHLDAFELLSMISLLILAGHETTSNLISIGTLMLLDHPDQLATLKADLGLVPAAVEELLRFNGPVIMPVPRFATEELELGGQHIQKGDLLLIALLSANRDEAQFTQPDDLDLARRLNRHLAFGQGIHMCLGAPLARLEGDIAFTTLLRRMPNLRLNVPRDTIPWRVTNIARGLTTLPVAF